MEVAQKYRTEAAVYGCLQGLYTYPMRKSKLTTLLELEVTDTRLQEHLGYLRSVIEDGVGQDDFLEQLDVEFTRLFVGPGQNPAPPYASFYLNEASLMGPETSAVRRVYLDWGVAPVDLDRIPDDHISVELSFMGYLNDQIHTALMENDDRRAQALFDAQTGFLRDHLLTWVPHFCDEVVSAAQQDFFIGLARLTQAQLENNTEMSADLNAAGDWRKAKRV